LPFAESYFDAIVSVDAYHYFGTADLYLAEILRFLVPGGQLGIVAPGVHEELADMPPQRLVPYWEPDFCTFHSPAWWQRHWEKTGLVVVEEADVVPNGSEQWLFWAETVDDWAVANGRPPYEREAAMLRSDAGETLTFTRVVSRSKKPAVGV
jgi:SAM-dependent methyltransferase